MHRSEMYTPEGVKFNKTNFDKFLMHYKDESLDLLRASGVEKLIVKQRLKELAKLNKQ